MLLTLVGLGLFYGIYRGARGLIEGKNLKLVLGCGFAALMFGLYAILKYWEYKAASTKLDPMSLARVDELVAGLKRARIADDPACLKFAGSDLDWKGRLFSDGVLLVGTDPLLFVESDILFLPKAAFHMERAAPMRFLEAHVPLPGTKPKVRVQIALGPGRSIFGRMEPQYFERYQSWKGVSLDALQTASAPFG